ncbi:hypothetical protein ACOMHN_021315 [Nucella lapillus]
MAGTWRALMKLFGLGKKEDEKNPPVRYHPYDEVSDDQLTENRRRAPRSHPYDEVSDEQLQQNRARGDEESENRSKAPRVHPYDEVEPPPPQQPCGGTGGLRPPAKMQIVSKENCANGTTSDSGLNMNYINVEIQPGRQGKGSNSRPSRAPEQPIIYSEVQPSARPT